MDDSDSFKVLSKLYPLTLYLQCRLDVLEGVVAAVSRDTRIGDKTVDEFLRIQLRERIHSQLGALSDLDPTLATEFLRILKDEGGIEL